METKIYWNRKIQARFHEVRWDQTEKEIENKIETQSKNSLKKVEIDKIKTKKDREGDINT